MTRAGMKIRRALRLAGWNALFLVAGLVLIGVVGEMYFRLRAPFGETFRPYAWSPNVGGIYAPKAEVRHTNGLDFWTESRTNGLGFVDREPISLERAAASCHVAMIGDSYVEASEVPIADKFHVRLEELAAEELRHLDITTSAFGISGTGQVNQLAYYDEFARYLRPALLVLVFVPNDFWNNAPILYGLRQGVDPDRLTKVSATRGADGTITLRPPHPPSAESRLATMASTSPPWYSRVTDRLIDMSLLSKSLDAKRRALSTSDDIDPELIAQVALLSRRSPRYAALLDGWRPTTRGSIANPFKTAQDMPAIYEDALDFTAFALDQFRERADRDGAALVILSSHYVGTRGDLEFDRLTALAEPRGIPVIDYNDYVLRQGAVPWKDATWAHDGHWNAAGHRWAAEALLEYLKRNQAICTTRKRPTAPPPSWLTDYESIASGEPAARSVFDVYTSENTVAYLKSPCSAADVQAEFFLQVIPEDLEDLPADRRQYGFDDANFRYGNTAALAFGGRCIMEYPLPDYPIARIRTGQFAPEGGHSWIVEGKPSWLTDYESIASGEPAARSVFDVYTSENTVAYLKSPCSAADVQAEFFLHVVPEDLEDLPADRRQYGFGGANFRYGEDAALPFGGRCVMEYPLPDYPIARIRTGQFTPEGDQIWVAEFPVGAVEGAPSP